jgi:GT2 family glycosyltransferase
MTVSVITPWHNHPELIPAYEKAVQGAQVIIVDNASDAATHDALWAMVTRLGEGSIVLGNETNYWFAEACNQGLDHAAWPVVLMLNNDIEAEPGWLAQVERDVRPGELVGIDAHVHFVAGGPVMYIAGWCVAARREVWEALGGFDAETFQRPYWEDVDLSWRAVQAGYTLRSRPWPVKHLGNTTSRTVDGAYAGSEANKAAFTARVQAARVTA